MILLADSEGPDQTARMRWLILALAIRICLKTCSRMDLDGIAKRRNQLEVFFCLFFLTKSAYKNKFSEHMHNFFLLYN